MSLTCFSEYDDIIDDLEDISDKDYRKFDSTLFTLLDCESEEDFNINLSNMSDRNKYCSFSSRSFHHIREAFKFYQEQYELNCFLFNRTTLIHNKHKFATDLDLSLSYLRKIIEKNYKVYENVVIEVVKLYYE